MAKNFSLVFINDKYEGWLLENPLDYIVDDFGYDFDTEKPDDKTYKIFSEYLEIVSDNFCNHVAGGDMSQVVNILKEKIATKIEYVIGNKRKLIIEEAIKELEDYYS